MVNESNFVIRKSGRKENSYYIDYMGSYKLNDIARIAGMEPGAVREKYLANGASYDESQEVYYFGSVESARKTIDEILKDMKSDYKGRLIFLTEAEIEYIRKALFN